jgi:dephospho-CoA kinase
MGKIIGITGGIGCGKSTLISMIDKRVMKIDTDKIVKYLMAPGNISYALIVEYFGASILEDDSEEIDRKKLASVVMSDKAKLEKLNSFTHPYVIDEVKNIIKRNEDEYDYFIVESALLLETKLKDICDEVWNVTASKKKRIERLCKYRGYTKEEAEAIINNQKPESYYMNNSDRTFINDADGGKDMVELLKISLQ